MKFFYIVLCVPHHGVADDARDAGGHFKVTAQL